MKKDRKSTTPLIAAHSANKNNHKPASLVKETKTTARVSNIPKQTTKKIKSLTLDRISEGIIAFDHDLNCTYVNERAGKLLGCKPKDLIGKNLRKGHRDAQILPFTDACQRAIETQTVVDFKEHFAPADTWLEGRAYPSEDGISVLFTDEMSPKEHETENQRREDRYRILFDTMQEGFLLAEVIHDQDGQPVDYRPLEANASMVRFLGKSREELVSHTARELFTLDEYDMDILKRASQVAVGGEPFFVEKYASAVNRWFRLHVFSPRHGQFANLLADITEFKRAEEKILDISKFPGQNPNPVMRFTQDGELLYANDAAQPLLAFWRRQHGQTVPAELEELLSSFIHDANMEIELEGDGKIFSCLLVPIHDSGYVNLYFRDITERKHVEQALVRERELLERIFETIPAMITIYDPATGLQRLNSQFKQRTGWGSEGVSPRELVEACYPDPEYRKKVIQLMRTCSPNEWIDIQMQTRDGRTLETTWSNLSFPDGMQVGMGIDITERKQGEQASTEYARRQTALYTLIDQLHRASTLDDVFNASLDAILNALQCQRTSILLFDETKSMHFVAWRGLSDEYRKATDGHSPWKYGEESPVPIFFNDITTAELSDTLKTVIAREGIGSLGFIPLVFQERLIGKFMVYFNTPHVFSESELSLSQTIARQLVSAIDRKRKEEELQQSEERFSRFMQYLPGLAWIKDRQGRYVFANAAAAKAFNTPQADLYGKTDQDIFPSDVASQFKQNDEQALMEGKSVQVIETLPQDDGVIHHSLVTKFPIPGPDGNTTLIGGTAFDITERVHMEEALRQARERAEETADRISRLQEVTAALTRSTTSMELAEMLLEQGTRSTGAAAGILVELINDGEELKTIAALGYPAAAVRTQPVPLSAPTPMSDSIKTRQAIWIRSQDEFAGNYPLLAEVRSGFGMEAIVALPLIVGDRALGAFAFSFTEPREFLLEERGFLLAVAQQCAQGLERVRAENALHESEERYRAIVNQATAGIVRKDALGKLMFVNDAFCSMLGYSRAELITKTMWQITHEQDVQENQRLFNRLMVEGMSFQLEKRLIRRDGSILWVTVSVSPVLDTRGRPQSAVSVYADITERKHAEEQLHKLNLELEDRVRRRTAELQSANEFLRESEATSRLILESVPDAIVITNPEGHVVHCNTQVESLFGYSPNELLGQHVEVLIPKRFHQQHLFHRQTFSEIPSRRMMGAGRQLFAQRRNGDEFPVEIALSPISNSTTWDVIITIRDNTEQRQAQESLRVSEEKLRTLFEILPVGISFLNRDAQIIEMNSALAQILGLSKQELLQGAFRSRKYIRANGSPMPRTEFASIRALTEQKTIYNVETGIIKENGEKIWTSVNAAPVKVADVEAVVVTVDITERKNAEEALHKNRERLRILSRRLVEVQEEERRAIARELHDRVGQNLAALNLNLNILRSQLSDDALTKVGTRLSDSVQLVNDILTITRSVMADLRSNVLDDYGLESALREYADQFTQRFGIRVVPDKTQNPIPRLDPSIEMTLLRIAQEALTNVARHAQASQVTITLNIESDTVHMAIQDNGIGILSWQKANQLGSHGLRIIRERTEAFGGSMQILSAYKKGTTIEVKIPIESGNQPRVPREKRS